VSRDLRATAAPATPSRSAGRDALIPRQSNITFNINALDGADVEKIVKQKVVPRLKFMMKTNEEGLGATIRETALE